MPVCKICVAMVAVGWRGQLCAAVSAYHSDVRVHDGEDLVEAFEHIAQHAEGAPLHALGETFDQSRG